MDFAGMCSKRLGIAVVSLLLLAAGVAGCGGSTAATTGAAGAAGSSSGSGATTTAAGGATAPASTSAGSSAGTGGSSSGAGATNGPAPSHPVSGHGTGTLQGNGKTLAMFTITASNIYGAVQIAGAQKMAKQLGYHLVVFQSNFSQPQQDQEVQQYVATGARPAASLIFPPDATAAVNSIRLLSRIGPVIMITSQPTAQEAPYVTAYAGANQFLIGEVAGEMLLKARAQAATQGMKLHSPNGNLFVFQHPQGEQTGIVRWEGFLHATAGHAFNVIGTQWGANSPETGYSIGSQVVPQIKGKVDFLYISNQQAANGVIRALKENGLRPGKDVVLVSSDCSGSVQAVQNGETFGTGVQSGAIEGELGVVTAAQYVATGKIQGTVRQYPVTPDQPSFSTTAPARFNYMPHAPAIGPNGVANTRIWGYTTSQICSGG